MQSHRERLYEEVALMGYADVHTRMVFGSMGNVENMYGRSRLRSKMHQLVITLHFII